VGTRFLEALFFVRRSSLLLEFSSTGEHTKDWLDAAVAKMVDIPRARLWVELHDVNGKIVYETTGVTRGKWTQNFITCPKMQQDRDTSHTKAICLENGDRMMIIGKQATQGWKTGGFDIYRPYNIIINAGWDESKMTSWYHPRRLIISLKVFKLGGSSTPGNFISYTAAGFTPDGYFSWPKFSGTFRIYYIAL